MTDDKIMKKHASLSIDARNSILEAIQASLKADKPITLDRIGSVSTALDALAARNLYSKGPPDDNYSKNTQRAAFDQLINPADLKGQFG